MRQDSQSPKNVTGGYERGLLRPQKLNTPLEDGGEFLEGAWRDHLKRTVSSLFSGCGEHWQNQRGCKVDFNSHFPAAVPHCKSRTVARA